MEILKSISLVMAIIISCYYLTACDNDLSVRQDYDFTVKVEKYRTDIAEGETMKFIFHWVREGNFVQTKYFVSCFIRDGQGEIRDKYGNELKMNTAYTVYDTDAYELSYTSQCSDSHTIELTFSDSFGNVREIIVELQNKRE